MLVPDQTIGVCSAIPVPVDSKLRPSSTRSLLLAQLHGLSKLCEATT
jgi:hypothetical protein